MHTNIYSAALAGVRAYQVVVEVDLAYGMLKFDIVGLADTAIKESKHRIQTALKNSGVTLPERKITVNLAPADSKKEGTLFDLPIAIGLLRAANLIPLTATWLQETVIVGELSLDGTIRPIKGALVIASTLADLKKKRLIVPQENAYEAALIPNIEVYGISHITDLIAWFRGEKTVTATKPSQPTFQQFPTHETLDFSQIKGQWQAKRALQIAAAGSHHLILVGPPGAGKTMLAKRLSSIMPPLSFGEIIETSALYSVSGHLGLNTLMTRRPFRNPHHTVSQAGLIGGGLIPQPGDVSLAHHGILFLDELTEFKRPILELLRQPLEQREITISRAGLSYTFPSSFILVAALNPCPCGFFGDRTRQCVCTPREVSTYLHKISGPLLDRIDIQISIPAVSYQDIKNKTLDAMNSKSMYQVVEKARAFAQQRSSVPNGLMAPDQVEQFCVRTPQAETILSKAFEQLRLTMRGYHKLLKIARTIADLDTKNAIDVPHIQEALLYRSLDHYLERNNT